MVEVASTTQGIEELHQEERHLCCLVMKTIRRKSLGSRHTMPHIPLLMLNLHLALGEIEAVGNTRAIDSVIGKSLACNQGIWKKVRKVNMR